MSISSSGRQVVRISELKNFSIQFPGDVYVLAVWVLAHDLVKSERYSNSTCRTTIHGLSSKLAYLTGLNLKVIESQFMAAGFPLGATIELDDNPRSHPPQFRGIFLSFG